MLWLLLLFDDKFFDKHYFWVQKDDDEYEPPKEIAKTDILTLAEVDENQGPTKRDDMMKKLTIKMQSENKKITDSVESEDDADENES